MKANSKTNTNMIVIALIAMAKSAARLVAGVESPPVSKDPAPSVLRTGNKVALQSPTFSFNLPPRSNC